MRTTPLITVIVSLFLLIAANFTSRVIAQENPLEESTQVTAIVSDITAPSTPILISPADEAKLKSSTLTFVWQAATDNWLMDHYKLYLNGTLEFDNIPLTATTSAEYTLTYDSLTTYYTLVPTASFNDGSYNWKIMAEDYHGNQSTSVTWDFSIDTQAPVFTITQIADQTVEITTGNVDSVPDDPITLEKNKPTLSGTGESNSTVVMTITFADGSEDEVTFTIGSDGTWSITLDTLPRNEIIELDFLITDPTGNISILEDVKLIIPTPYIVIPVPIPIPIPGVPPVEPGPPVIEIPVLPPIEYVPPIIRDTPKQVVFYIRNATATVKEHIITWKDTLLLLLVLPVLLALPMLKLTLLSLWHWHHLSKDLLKQILFLIFPFGTRNPQGLVLDLTTQAAVTHGLVFVSGKTTDGLTTRVELLCDGTGVFPARELPDGEYRLSVQHPQYFFPTLTKKPVHLDSFTFYVGGSFTVKSGSTLPPFIVPVELLQKQQHVWFYDLRKAILLAPSLSLALGALAAALTLAYPSLANIIATGVYGVLYATKKVREGLTNTEILTFQKNKEPLPAVAVAVQSQNEQHLSFLGQTNSRGSVLIKISPGEYTACAAHFKHRLTEGDNKTKTRFSTDASINRLVLVLD